MKKIGVGIQLYTLRDDCARDFKGTIEAVSRMGYEGVELAGNPGLPASEVKKMLADNNLKVAGNHSPIDDLQNRLNQVIDYNLEAGNRRIVCPWLPEEFQKKGADGYREAARILDEVGARLKEKGFSLSYHNHSFEFNGKEDGKYYLDILFETASPDHLKSELDTYWVQHGGCDPVQYILNYSGRIELLHIKDMLNDANRSFAEIGAGILHWEGIFQAASQAGIDWYLVEQDVCPGPPIESARKSLDFLREQGLV